MERTYDIEQIEAIAEEIISAISPNKDTATVIGLSGELGAGKTTLIKSIAEILGVDEEVVSPTFVIAKFYDTKSDKWKRLVHVDAYRIDDIAELDQIDFNEIVSDKDTILIIEWPERVSTYLPKHTYHFKIDHGENNRKIQRK